MTTNNLATQLPQPSRYFGLRRSTLLFAGATVLVAIILIAAVNRFESEYAYLAVYSVLQFVALATAWNILGGYGGYVNFGTAGFFAVGAYTTIALEKAFGLPLLLIIPIAGIVTGLIGLGAGYLTLRLRGVFFSIATLALAVVLQTFVTNWNYVGGARGAYMVRPDVLPIFGSYAEFLFILMLGLAIICVAIARTIEKSWLGKGLAALRDDEVAAEASGVPALRLKLFAAVTSGALMGMIGAPFPYFITFIDPPSAFSLTIAVNTIAMPLIGGTATWIGPVIGAVLLGTVQQIATVTISSAANLLIVGLLLIFFITMAPKGIVGLVGALIRRRA